MRVLNRILDHFATALYLAMMVLVAVQIFFRFVLRVGVPWTEEISRLIFLYLAFLGAAMAMKEGTMIAVDVLPLRLKGRARRLLDLGIDLFGLAFLAVMLRGSLHMTAVAWPTVLATVEWVSNGWLYVAMDLSFALMILYSGLRVLQGLAALARPGRAQPEAGA